jgi:hypothetical protein
MSKQQDKPIVNTVGELIELLKKMPSELQLCLAVDCGLDPSGDQKHDWLHYEAMLEDWSLTDTCHDTPGVFVEETEGECTEFVILRLKAVLQHTDDPESSAMIFSDGTNQLHLRNLD